MQLIIKATSAKHIQSEKFKIKSLENLRIANYFPLVILPPKRSRSRVAIVALGGH